MGTFQRGLRNVVRHPMRLALVVLLLGTSLMFTGAMVALNASAQSRINAVQNNIGTAITIAPVIPANFAPPAPGSNTSSFKPPSVPDSLLPRIQKTRGVVAVTEFLARNDSTLKGTVQGSSFAPRVIGMTPATTLTIEGAGGKTTVNITHGRALTASDDGANVAIAGAPVARVNGWHVGSDFTLHGVKVRLVGTYSTGSPVNDDSVIMPYQTRKHIYHTSSAEYMTAFAVSSTQVTAVENRLKSALGSGVDVHVDEATVNQINSLSAVQSNVHAGLIGAIATAVLVILFAILLTVRERAREIGVLRSLGASVATIVGQFAVEVSALTAAAAGLAVLLLVAAGPTIASAFGATTSTASGSSPAAGVITIGSQSGGGGSASTQALGLSAGLTPESILALCGFAIVLALLASAFPAYVVARLKPAQVLRQA